jgi:hypothetical protein
VLPSVEEVHELEEICKTGNVRKLREALERLETDVSLKPFCEPLLTFCAGYRMNAAREHLEEARKELDRRARA